MSIYDADLQEDWKRDLDEKRAEEVLAAVAPAVPDRLQVHITGSRGAGKTALARMIAQAMEGRNAKVVFGDGAPELPLAPKNFRNPVIIKITEDTPAQVEPGIGRLLSGNGVAIGGVGVPGAGGVAIPWMGPIVETPPMAVPATPTPAPTPVTIDVYLDDGRVFTYSVNSAAKAREHSHAIVTTGYRHVSADAPDVLEHYPPHRITKVKVTGAITTNYTDSVRGT